MAAESNQVSTMIMVTVKLLNGDIIQLETDLSHGCDGIKQHIHTIHSEMITEVQQLIRVEDHIVDPKEIRDGDVFLLVVRIPLISFYREDDADLLLWNEDKYLYNLYRSGHQSRLNLYTIFLDGVHFIQFIYDAGNQGYVDCDQIHSTNHNGWDQIYIEKGAQWFPSLTACIAVSKHMPETAPLLEGMNARFQQFHDV